MVMGAKRSTKQRIQYYIGRLKVLQLELINIRDSIKLIIESKCKSNDEFSNQCLMSRFYFAVANKLIQMISAIESMDPQSILLATRYVLELLINLKLLEKDRDYIYCIYKELIEQYIKFVKIQIEKTKREMGILEQLNRVEHEILQEALIPLIKKTVRELNKSDDIKEHIVQELLLLLPRTFMKAVDRFAEKEFLLYSEDAKHMGYGFTAYQLREKGLPELERKLKELQEYENNFYSHVESMNIHLDNLCNNAPKTWKDKARITGLEEDYNIIYHHTSSILHATPASVMHERILEDAEIYIFIRYLYVRMYDTTELIRKVIAEFKAGLNSVK